MLAGELPAESDRSCGNTRDRWQLPLPLSYCGRARPYSGLMPASLTTLIWAMSFPKSAGDCSSVARENLGAFPLRGLSKIAESEPAVAMLPIRKRLVGITATGTYLTQWARGL